MNEAHAIVRAMKVSETEIDSVRGHLAAGLSRANRPLDALPFAEAIKQAMLRSSVLAQVAEAFIRLSRPDDAVPLLTMAIDADPRSLYVGQAIAALAASGRTQDAMALLERPGAAGAQNAIWRETATGSVVTGLIESGQIMDAAILAAKITSARPAAVQLAAVAAALARRQRLDDARAFVREVHARIDTARRTDKPNQIEQALTQIATRFATGGLDDEASAILTTLSSTAGDQALDRILDALMNEGRAEAALTLFERQSARWNETRRAGTRREIVSALAKAAGLAGGAEAILADARFETHADLDAVAVGLAASGALEAARNAVGRLPDGSRRDATTCAMSRAFASARAYSDARRAVARCPPEGRWMATMFVLDEFAMNEHPEIKEQKAILRAYRDGG
jgi:tetratricopeptide (TPR) repeat protein